mmetsp:Transcript_5420/g.16414  ORF Transcript_5420/g.16414 Transcript_5420/m.16414 type:complete len:365 (+) Transcript_5420:5462-6556(+)
MEGLNHPLELVADVQLVRIEQEQDQVGPLREPAHHLGELVAPLQPLLLPGEDSRGVHNVDGIQELGRHLRSRELVQELLPKLCQTGVGLVRRDRQGVAGHRLCGHGVGDDHKPIGGRLRPDHRGRVLLAQEVLDEAGLPHTVLPEHHHRRLCREILRPHDRGVEEGKLELLLQRLQVLHVELAEAVLEAVDVLHRHFGVHLGPQPELALHGRGAGLHGRLEGPRHIDADQLRQAQVLLLVDLPGDLGVDGPPRLCDRDQLHRDDELLELQGPPPLAVGEGPHLGERGLGQPRPREERHGLIPVHHPVLVLVRLLEPLVKLAGRVPESQRPAVVRLLRGPVPLLRGRLRLALLPLGARARALLRR